MSIIRIGCFKSNSDVETNGTGFIVKYWGKYFVITCKHVIMACKTQNYFMIINTTNQPIPQENRNYISLNKPFYHPNDTVSNSKDIAIFTIDDVLLKRIGQCFYELKEEIVDDVDVYGSGYPNEYILQNMSLHISYLEPYKICGRYFSNIDISNLNQNGLKYKVNGITGTMIEKPPFRNLSGISGGPLILNKDNTVLGLISFAGIDTITNEYGQRISLLGIIPSNFIIETLNCIV